MRRLILVLALLAALAGLDGARRSAGAVGLPVCGFSMTNEVFGSLDVLVDAAASTSATLTITCSGQPVMQTIYVCVSFSSATMIGPSASPLAYDLLGPSPARSAWSSTTPIVFPVPVLGGSTSVTIPAILLGGQSGAPPGAYVEVVTATVQVGTTGCTTGTTATSSIVFSVTATIVKSCTVSAGDLAFAAVGDLDTAVLGQSQIVMRCSAGTPYSVALDGGSSGAGDPTRRRMVFGARGITYGLYRDSAHTLPWGSTPGGNTLAGLGTALTQSIPVYGLVPVQPTPPPGTYTDTIVVSVTY